MEELKIEYIPINQIKPYEKNARKHQDADVRTIINSIREFGFDDPIGVWGEDNIIVEGHGRLLAAQKLGMDTVPVIRLDHLTDEQRRAYALAHNKTAEMSEWDFGILGGELDDIYEIDMGQFGFSEPVDLWAFMENEEFASVNEKDTFGFTVQIPLSYKKNAEEYAKKNGKEKIAAYIIKEVSENA